MRQDVREEVRKYMIEDLKPNYAAIADRFNCDYRTVKKAYEEEKQPISSPETKVKRPSKLDPFKESSIRN